MRRRVEGEGVEEEKEEAGVKFLGPVGGDPKARE